MLEKQLKNLSPNEKEFLLNAPVLAALLGALEEGAISDLQKAEAIHLSHLKTFTSPFILHEYYHEVEKSFSRNFSKYFAALPKENDEAKSLVEAEIVKLDELMKKMDSEFSKELADSLQRWVKHISGTKPLLKSWLKYFIFPLNLEKEI